MTDKKKLSDVIREAIGTLDAAGFPGGFSTDSNPTFEAAVARILNACTEAASLAPSLRPETSKEAGTWKETEGLVRRIVESFRDAPGASVFVATEEIMRTFEPFLQRADAAPARDPDCEVHKHHMPDGRCTCGKRRTAAGTMGDQEDAARLDWLERQFCEFDAIKAISWCHDGRRWINNDTLLVHRMAGRGGQDESLREAIDAARQSSPSQPEKP